MKITSIQPICLSVPLRKPMFMAGRTIETLDTVLVRLETDGKHAGWGEAPVAPMLTGETREGIVSVIGMIAEALHGADLRDPGRIALVIDGTLVGNPAAKAAVEVAAYDAIGRNSGVPLSTLLGGRRVDRLHCLHLLGAGEPEKDLAEARAAAETGFRAIKYKVANGNIEQEAETLVSLRRVLGNDVLLCADANGGWSRSQAMSFVRLAKESAADFLEQPVVADDHEGMAKVAETSSIPLAADEALHSIVDMRRLLEMKGARGGSLKIMKLAGMGKCLDACRLIHALGGEINLSSKVGETSIGNAATLAVASVWGRPSWGLSLTNGYLAADPVKQPIEVRAGQVHSLDGPGLGIEVDERQLERLSAT